MKKTIPSIITAVGLLAGGTALAADETALAQAKGCLNCHKVDTKLVGPAYKDVAAKYRDNKDAAATLAAKIKAGGVGNWGQIPMPPNNVTDEEAARLAAWVLSH